jgi:hypothetical protein
MENDDREDFAALLHSPNHTGEDCQDAAIRYAYQTNEAPPLRSMVSRPHETVTKQKKNVREGSTALLPGRFTPTSVPARGITSLETKLRGGWSKFDHFAFGASSTSADLHRFGRN